MAKKDNWNNITTVCHIFKFENAENVDTVREFLASKNYTEAICPEGADLAMYGECLLSDHEEALAEDMRAILRMHFRNQVQFLISAIVYDKYNIEKWQALHDLGYDPELIRAAIDDGYSLQDPDGIAAHIRFDYIGEFSGPEELAEWLSIDDPRLEKLDPHVRDCLDLAAYYRDEIRFGFSNPRGSHWFAAS